jgi:glycosyltransferase involved in cell wall biosynthesis
VVGLTLKLADGVIANSQAGLTAHGISPLKGVVIYNGFDMERLKLCAKDVDHSTECFTVIMAARMTPQKDFRTFIQAAYEMNKLGMRAHFMVVGNGILRPELIKVGEDLVKKGYLSFPEAGMEIIPFLNRANVGVLMTNQLIHAEGISNTIMEYMACGLPVICNISGGNQEIVIENETGFLISSGDVQQLVEKLTFLYNNPIVSKKMGQAGYNRLISTFSGEKMVENMVTYYKSIMNLHKNKNGLVE